MRDHLLRNALSLNLSSPLLVLEASTSAASVALFINGRVVSERNIVMGPSQDDAMLPAVADLLHGANVAPHDVRDIVCGSGPGSFTSLRIAASLAKGLAVANGARLFAIPSLLLAAATLVDSPGSYVLHADALRGDRYMMQLLITPDGHVETSGIATRMSMGDVARYATVQRSEMISVGTAPIAYPDLRSVQPHANALIAFATVPGAVCQVSVDTWEPDYGRVAEAQAKWELANGRPLPQH